MSVANQTNYPNWTPDQWKTVEAVVQQEAQQARAAAPYLALYGPVPTSVLAVPNLRVGNIPNPPYAQLRAANRLNVDSTPGTFLATISIMIPLASHEVADPELQAALGAFRRAAVTIAHAEDALIFNGQPVANRAPTPTLPGGWLPPLSQIVTFSGGYSQPGLVPTGAWPTLAPPLGLASVAPRFSRQNTANIATDVIAAIGGLEAAGHSGRFACFLSNTLFEASVTPAAGSQVMPRDRIIPFLGGEYLRRTHTVPDDYGIVVALGGNPVEIVVASDISVTYLQQTTEPRFLFRISERIALRVKEWDAVAVLHP